MAEQSDTFPLQATGRLRKNAAYFRVNYLMFVGLVTAVCFCLHPASLIVVAFLSMAWVYLFVVRQAPIVIGGRTFRQACPSSSLQHTRVLVQAPPLSVAALFWRSRGASLLQRAGEICWHLSRLTYHHILPHQVRPALYIVSGSELVGLGLPNSQILTEGRSCIWHNCHALLAVPESATSCSVGTILFLALGISVAGIALHGSCRVPDDLFTDEAEVGIAPAYVGNWYAHVRCSGHCLTHKL